MKEKNKLLPHAGSAGSSVHGQQLKSEQLQSNKTYSSATEDTSERITHNVIHLEEETGSNGTCAAPPLPIWTATPPNQPVATVNCLLCFIAVFI